MLNVILLTILFSLTTVASITIIGSRELIGGEIGMARLVRIILDWRFIIGAIFAFASRIIFLLINSALYKIPHLSGASTTLTVFVTSIATVFVIVANYFFLGEKINIVQGIGVTLILLGTFIVVR